MATHAMSPGDLEKAAAACNLGECRRLLEAGVPVDNVGGWSQDTALGIAARNGFLDVAALMVEKGADVDRNSKGHTPVWYAAGHGHTAVVGLLLDNDANVDKSGFRDGPPLMFALMNRRTDVVKLLLKNGAAANARNLFGETALRKAAQARTCESVCALLAVTLPTCVAV